MIRVTPDKYRQLGDATGCDFVLLTNSSIIDSFEFAKECGYVSCSKHACDTEADFLSRLAPDARVRPTHYLVISPNVLFKSPPPELLGVDSKVLVMPCNSTQLDIDSIGHFLQCMVTSDPDAQQVWADRFFSAAEVSSRLTLSDARHGTQATFQHMNDEYEWFEQLGMLDWGSQQFAPAGEISVLPMFHGNYDAKSRLDINGTIAFHGFPIVNSGTPSFLRGDQEKIYSMLEEIEHAPLIAEVENGVITAVSSEQDTAALKIIESLFMVDSRYRIIWELGIGSHTGLESKRGNFAPNESFGGVNGSVHFGLGLTPWTQYHIDIVCPGISVATDSGVVIAGPSPNGMMQRTRTAGCPCIS